MESSEPEGPRSRPTSRRRVGVRTSIALVAALVFPLVAWESIVRSAFFSDDFVHLQQLVNEPLLRFVLTPGAGHLYLVRNLVFFVFYRLFGPHPECFFAIVLATHLANVALLFAVIRRLTGRDGIAVFGATAWGIAPAHEGTLGWYSVYGQVLTATCLLLVLVAVVRRWRSGEGPRLADAVRWGLLLLGGAACFGVGIGVALVFPAVVLLLFAGRQGSRAARIGLVAALPVAVVGTYWGAQKLYAYWYGYPADQAVLALVRMLADWRKPLAMLAHMLAVGVTVVVGNVAYRVEGYPDAAGYAMAGAFAVALVADFATTDARRRRLELALVAFAVGAYLMIALGRGVLYAANADRFRAYGAALWRYHYVGPIPIAVLLCLLLARAADVLRIGPRVGTAVLVAWFAGAGTAWATFRAPIDHFDEARRTTDAVVATIADALARTPPPGIVTLRNQRFPPAIVDALFAGWASVYTIYFPATDDARIRFVEPLERVRAMALPGSRLARVLVAPSPGVPVPPVVPVPR